MASHNIPHAAFRPLPLGSIKPAGWIERQLRVEARGANGHMDELEPALLVKPYLTREPAPRVSVAWCSEISATYWTGLVQLAYTLDDAVLKAKAERWVRGILAAQEADGYLGSYRTSDNRREDYNAFGVAWAVRALLAYHEATGSAQALSACHRGLLWFVTHWADHKTDYAGPMIIESMALVCLLTGDRRLADWAESYLNWLDAHSRWPNSVAALASGELDYASMHAVAYGMAIPLPAMVHMALGRPEYLKASVNAARKVMACCGQRTGAVSSNKEYLSPPGALCETEYCNIATYAGSFRWLGAITGDALYGDWIEKIVFNAAMGAIKKDGRAMAYMTAPNQAYATLTSSCYGNHPDMQAYAPVHPVACCPTQAVRLLPEYVRGLCLNDADGNLCFTCYGPCRVRVRVAGGVVIECEERTDYPFDDTLEFHLRPEQPAECTLSFKVPLWCSAPAFAVNGQAVDGAPPAGGFVRLRRRWQAGDVVRVRFPMQVVLVQVNDGDHSAKFPYAVERGPLLFAYPLPTRWTPVPGNPLTPLPEGWSWFDATPMEPREEVSNWNLALDGERMFPLSALEVRVRSKPDANPWAESPVTLHVPVRTIRTFCFPRTTMDVYGKHWKVTDEIKMVGLVPFGCTNLRIAYFPMYRPDAVQAC